METTLDLEARVVATLRTVLPKKTREQAIDGAASLMALGLDSLKFLEFLLALEEAFGVPLTEDVLKLQRIETVGDAVALVAAAAQRS